MDHRIRTIIVDDNKDSLDILNYYMQQLPDFIIVDECRNGEELIESVMRTDPQLIMLDINMPKLNGMDAARACLQIKNELLFIFVTSFDEYAVQAFELSAVDYIVKPVEKARLYAALEKAKASLNSRSSRTRTDCPSNHRLLIRDSSDYYYIPVQQILFIEKLDKKCHIHTGAKVYISNENIGVLLSQLPSGLFYLSHRSYIVNLSQITHISAQNQTYLAYFSKSDKYAHVSKLKFEEIQKKLKHIV